MEIAYEHRNYLPYFGLTLILVESIQHLLKNSIKLKSFLKPTIAIVLIILGSATFTRTSQWSSPLSFAYFEVKHHPYSVRANHTLGMTYRSLVLDGKLEHKDNSFKYLKIAAELDSRHIQPEAALIQLSYELGENASPQWINSIARKLKDTAPKLDHILLLKELTRCHNNTCLLPSDACEHLLDAAISNPRISKFPLTHSTLLSIKGNFLLERSRNTADAERLFQTAIKISPHKTQYYADYINLLLLLNRPDEAQNLLEKAYATDPHGKHSDKLIQLGEIIKNNN